MNDKKVQEEPWPESWAVQASVDAARIQNRLDAATSGVTTAAAQAARAAVQYHLSEVRSACRCKTRLKRRGLRDKWRGMSVERAYMHLHAAKIFLSDVLPDAEFEATVPEVVTRLATVLDRNDPRRIEIEDLLKSPHPKQRRAALKQAMEIAYDASDEEYVRLRDFRNIILLTAAALALLTGTLVALVALSPAAIPLCFEPGVTTAVAGQAVGHVQMVCPSGDYQRPTGGDILIVAGLGAVGGALGAIVAIRNLRGTSTPYPVSMALAILKVPAGALSAIIGMLLLSGGFVPGLTNLDDQRQILAYALVFGIAQQLVTRVADSRAQQILDHLPSKDSQANPPQPPVRASNNPAALPIGTGPDGGDGAAGANGKDGSAGTNGKDGSAGTNGKDGSAGNGNGRTGEPLELGDPDLVTANAAVKPGVDGAHDGQTAGDPDGGS